MKISLYIALSFMTLSFGGCTSTPDGYSIDDDEVRYVYRDLTSNTWINKAIPADAATFQSFEDGFHLAKDKNHVFKRGEIWDAFDAPSFEVLSAKHYSDKNGIFHNDTSLVGVDRATLKIVSEHLSMYKNALFYRGVRLDLCDAATLEIPGNRISERYIYDSKCAYYLTAWAAPKAGFRVSENLKNFTELSRYYAKDPDNVYGVGQVIADADPSSFELIGALTARDHQSIFYRNERVKDADVETFRLIGRGYAADKNAVFFGGKRLRGVDPDTFETIAFESGEPFGAPDAKSGETFYSLGRAKKP